MQDFLGLSLAFGSVFFIGVMPFALLSLAIPYAVLRLRNEEPADPQLGTKIGLQYFFSVSVILCLTGLTIMAVDLVTRDNLFGAPPPQQPQPQLQPQFAPPRPPVRVDNEGFNAAQRTGLGLALSGALAAALHLALGFILTNRVHWPRVRRTFAGWRFVIHGAVVMFAATGLIIMLLQKDGDANFRATKALLAVLGVWIPAWAIQLGLLKLYSWMSSRPDTPSITIGTDED